MVAVEVSFTRIDASGCIAIHGMKKAFMVMDAAFTSVGGSELCLGMQSVVILCNSEVAANLAFQRRVLVRFPCQSRPASPSQSSSWLASCVALAGLSRTEEMGACFV